VFSTFFALAGFYSVNGQTTEGPLKSDDVNISPNSDLAGENLTPYQPSGWDTKIVVSTRTRTCTSASTIYTTNNLYVDRSVINNGATNITKPFYTRLFIDGSLRKTWYSSSLSYGYYVSLIP
jgi:hypothetical protein